jgi:hypothetical protein
MKDTIDMAREVGFVVGRGSPALAKFERLIAMARADERDACYTIAKFNQANHLEHLTADQIKARGETK